MLRLNPDPSWMKRKRLILMILAVLLFSSGGLKTALCEVIHIGISPQTIPNANINDALAAIKVWTRNAAKIHGIQATFEVEIIDSPAELRDGLDKERFEIITTSIDTILPLTLSCGTVFVAKPKGAFPVRYALVVHRDSGITTPGELKNGIVTIPSGDFMQLAGIWLKAYIQTHLHTAASSILPNVAYSEDVPKAGIQVFFRQIDATVMRRDTLDRMGKLNPQMKKDLRIIGESVPLIPIVLIIRSSWQTPIRHAVEKILSEFHTTSLGKQVLAVFHCARLEKHPITILKPTLSFLRNTHEGFDQKTGGCVQK